jgi:4-aminobutyrate aminotransferase
MDRETWAARNRDARVQSLLDRDAAAYLRQSGSTPCLSAVRRARGVWIEDWAGRRYMDFHGNTAHHVGYGHPRLIAAIKRQLDELPYAPRRYTDEPAILLAEKLSSIWPGRPGKVLLAPGGSQAVEIALMLARVATGRHKTLSFRHSYHGNGFAALSVGGDLDDAEAARIGPLVPGALHVPPYYRLPPHADDEPADSERWARESLDAIRQAFQREPDVGCLIAEPVRQTPHVPPPWFWPEARKLCRAAGALLVFDEIPTGLGKSGRMFSCEHSGVVPDATVLGKALGGAVVPVAAVIADAKLDVAPEMSIGHYTHEKNPVLARAALTTIEIIEDEGLVERARTLGERALARLREIARRQPCVREARGLGLLLAVEFRDDPASGRRAGPLARSVLYRALEKGVSASVTEGATLRLSPPLVVSETELDGALDIVEEAIAEAAES